MTRESLRSRARSLLDAALSAADPRTAVHDALRLDGGTLTVGGDPLDLRETERIRVAGAGKAAVGMARGACDALGERLAGGTITTKDGHGAPLPRIDVWEAAHPVPDARGLAGAAEALSLSRAAEERDLLLCLLSGGASALWPAPPAGVFLGDLQEVTGALLRAGAPITELNAVRKHLSRLSGGQLARAVRPARLVTLVLSDVVGSPLDVIASGPTVPDPTTYAEALEVLRLRAVEAPPRVLRHLQAGAAGEVPENPKPGDPLFNGAVVRVVAENRDALRGVAREAERLGFECRTVTGSLEGEAREAAERIVAEARRAREERAGGHPLALLWGGETTVTVRGGGRGGRNQELALAAALLLEGEEGIVIASCGTDGTDGPTDAAGGIVDGGTVQRGRQAGLDAREHLARNDSYPFLKAAGDLLVTGPTGTNVNDVVVSLVRE